MARRRTARSESCPREKFFFQTFVHPLSQSRRFSVPGKQLPLPLCIVYHEGGQIERSFVTENETIGKSTHPHGCVLFSSWVTVWLKQDFFWKACDYEPQQRSSAQHIAQAW
jgi:hypothetical protein